MSYVTKTFDAICYVLCYCDDVRSSGRTLMVGVVGTLWNFIMNYGDDRVVLLKLAGFS